jgi:PAS domain S-box-containing protein
VALSDTITPVQAPSPSGGLDASENRLESFARIADGWFWETDAEHRFTYMSDSVELITGVKPDWHYGKSRRDIGVPDSVDPIIWQEHLDVLDRHQPFENFVFARKGPDRVNWMQTSGKPLFDAHGVFHGYRGIASDITAQIEAERRIETLADAIEQLSDMFVLWGPDDRLVLCNKSFRELNQSVIEMTEPGTLFETYIRAGLENNLFPEAKGREEAWLQERLDKHQNPGGPFEIQRRGGQWLLLNEQRLQNGGIVTISSDVTAAKKSLAQANEQENIVETSLRAMPDGMLIVDDDLEFISWNDRLFEILELNKELIVTADSPAKTFRYMMASRGEYGEGNLDRVVAEHESTIRDSEPVIMEKRLVTGRWIEIRSYPIPTGGYVAIFRDFTEQRAILRMKDEFISTVSHELRTPLTSLLGSVGLVESGALGELSSQASDLMKIARDNGERLLALINDLLDVEQIASGKMSYQKEELDLSDVLAEALAAHEGYASQFNVTVEMVDEYDGARIYADRTRILQVMANLLSNATKYSPKEGTVRIHTEIEDSFMRISVADNGPGIPEEFQSQIFEKFTQADSSDTRRVGGTGLGLAICQAIIEHHQGNIGFTTEVDIGTTFHVTLPLHS